MLAERPEHRCGQCPCVVVAQKEYTAAVACHHRKPRATRARWIGRDTRRYFPRRPAGRHVRRFIALGQSCYTTRTTNGTEFVRGPKWARKRVFRVVNTSRETHEQIVWPYGPIQQRRDASYGPIQRVVFLSLWRVEEGGGVLGEVQERWSFCNKQWRLKK